MPWPYSDISTHRPTSQAASQILRSSALMKIPCIKLGHGRSATTVSYTLTSSTYDQDVAYYSFKTPEPMRSRSGLASFIVCLLLMAAVLLFAIATAWWFLLSQ